MKLQYKDYRPIREGDVGYSDIRKKARWYYSPSTHTSITYRQYVTLSRGMSYERYAQEKQKKGVIKKQYRPRKGKVTGGVIQKPEKPLSEKKRYYKGVKRSKYIERALILKDAYAHKKGTRFEDLSDLDKTIFWEVYHSLVDDHMPTLAEYEEDYADFFDLQYEEIEDLSYGTTP